MPELCSSNRIHFCDTVMSRSARENKDIRTRQELLNTHILSPLYPTGNDVTLRHTLGSLTNADPYDRVGIVHSCNMDVNHPSVCQMGPAHLIYTAKPQETSRILPATFIQPLAEQANTYQCLYVSGSNKVLGVSQPFSIAEHTCDDGQEDFMQPSNDVEARDSQSANQDILSCVSVSSELLSSDEEWEFAAQSAIHQGTSSTSFLSDIVVLSTSPSKEAVKMNADSEQAEDGQVDLQEGACESFSDSLEDNPDSYSDLEEAILLKDMNVNLESSRKSGASTLDFESSSRICGHEDYSMNLSDKVPPAFVDVSSFKTMMETESVKQPHGVQQCSKTLHNGNITLNKSDRNLDQQLPISKLTFECQRTANSDCSSENTEFFVVIPSVTSVHNTETYAEKCEKEQPILRTVYHFMAPQSDPKNHVFKKAKLTNVRDKKLKRLKQTGKRVIGVHHLSDAKAADGDKDEELQMIGIVNEPNTLETNTDGSHCERIQSRHDGGHKLEVKDEQLKSKASGRTHEEAKSPQRSEDQLTRDVILLREDNAREISKKEFLAATYEAAKLFLPSETNGIEFHNDCMTAVPSLGTDFCKNPKKDVKSTKKKCPEKDRPRKKKSVKHRQQAQTTCASVADGRDVQEALPRAEEEQLKATEARVAKEKLQTSNQTSQDLPGGDIEDLWSPTKHKDSGNQTEVDTRENKATGGTVGLKESGPGSSCGQKSEPDRINSLWNSCMPSFQPDLVHVYEHMNRAVTDVKAPRKRPVFSRITRLSKAATMAKYKVKLSKRDELHRVRQQIKCLLLSRGRIKQRYISRCGESKMFSWVSKGNKESLEPFKSSGNFTFATTADLSTSITTVPVGTPLSVLQDEITLLDPPSKKWFTDVGPFSGILNFTGASGSGFVQNLAVSEALPDIVNLAREKSSSNADVLNLTMEKRPTNMDAMNLTIEKRHNNIDDANLMLEKRPKNIDVLNLTMKKRPSNIEAPNLTAEKRPSNVNAIHVSRENHFSNNEEKRSSNIDAVNVSAEKRPSDTHAVNLASDKHPCSAEVVNMTTEKRPSFGNAVNLASDKHPSSAEVVNMTTEKRPSFGNAVNSAEKKRLSYADVVKQTKDELNQHTLSARQNTETTVIEIPSMEDITSCQQEPLQNVFIKSEEMASKKQEVLLVKMAFTKENAERQFGSCDAKMQKDLDNKRLRQRFSWSLNQNEEFPDVFGTPLVCQDTAEMCCEGLKTGSEHAEVMQTVSEHAEVMQTVSEHAEVMQTVSEHAEVMQTVSEHAEVMQTVPEVTDNVTLIYKHTESSNYPQQHVDNINKLQKHAEKANSLSSYRDNINILQKHTDNINIPAQHTDIRNNLQKQTDTINIKQKHTDIINILQKHTHTITHLPKKVDNVNILENHTENVNFLQTYTDSSQCVQDASSLTNQISQINVKPKHSETVAFLSKDTENVNLLSHHTKYVNLLSHYKENINFPSKHTEKKNMLSKDIININVPSENVNSLEYRENLNFLPRRIENVNIMLNDTENINIRSKHTDFENCLPKDVTKVNEQPRQAENVSNILTEAENLSPESRNSRHQLLPEPETHDIHLTWPLPTRISAPSWFGVVSTQPESTEHRHWRTTVEPQDEHHLQSSQDTLEATNLLEGTRLQNKDRGNVEAENRTSLVRSTRHHMSKLGRTLTIAMADNRDLKRRVDVLESKLNSLYEIQRQQCRSSQDTGDDGLTTTSHELSCKGKVKAVKHKRVPKPGWTDEVGTVFRSRVKPVTLKSEVRNKDTDIRDLQHQINGVNEVLGNLTNKAFTVHIKCHKLKVNINDRKVKLKSGKTDDGSMKMTLTPEDAEVEDVDSPQDGTNLEENRLPAEEEESVAKEEAGTDGVTASGPEDHPPEMSTHRSLNGVEVTPHSGPTYVAGSAGTNNLCRYNLPCTTFTSSQTVNSLLSEPGLSAVNSLRCESPEVSPRTLNYVFPFKGPDLATSYCNDELARCHLSVSSGASHPFSVAARVNTQQGHITNYPHPPFSNNVHVSCPCQGIAGPSCPCQVIAGPSCPCHLMTSTSQEPPLFPTAGFSRPRDSYEPFSFTSKMASPYSHQIPLRKYIIPAPKLNNTRANRNESLDCQLHTSTFKPPTPLEIPKQSFGSVHQRVYSPSRPAAAQLTCPKTTQGRSKTIAEHQCLNYPLISSRYSGIFAEPYKPETIREPTDTPTNWAPSFKNSHPSPKQIIEKCTKYLGSLCPAHDYSLDNRTCMPWTQNSLDSSQEKPECQTPITRDYSTFANTSSGSACGDTAAEASKIRFNPTDDMIPKSCLDQSSHSHHNKRKPECPASSLRYPVSDTSLECCGIHSKCSHDHTCCLKPELKGEDVRKKHCHVQKQYTTTEQLDLDVKCTHQNRQRPQLLPQQSIPSYDYLMSPLPILPPSPPSLSPDPSQYSALPTGKQNPYRHIQNDPMPHSIKSLTHDPIAQEFLQPFFPYSHHNQFENNCPKVIPSTREQGQHSPVHAIDQEIVHNLNSTAGLKDAPFQRSCSTCGPVCGCHTFKRQIESSNACHQHGRS